MQVVFSEKMGCSRFHMQLAKIELLPVRNLSPFIIAVPQLSFEIIAYMQ